MPSPKLAIDIHADASDLSQAVINFAGSGDNIIVVGVTSQVIRIWKIFFIVGAATNITYKSDGTAVSGPLPFSDFGAMVLDFDTKPWVTCGVASSFVLNSSNAVQVSGTVYYTNGP